MAKVKFEDLDGWLKATVIVTWAMAGLTALGLLLEIVASLYL